MHARPKYLDQLSRFEKERQGEVLRQCELWLARYEFDKARQQLDLYQQEVAQQQYPLEVAGIRPVAIRSLNRAGIFSLVELRNASDELLAGLTEHGASLETISYIKSAQYWLLRK
jgi:hypothetical protein